ncbi:MAG: twin-arginine translocase subunit TatC [Bacteroidota bacterium]|nr:twin-arginine translocase subunit TatC [Bacteroidota bacterium]
MALDQINSEEEVPVGEKEMSFLDHLEELRGHIIRSVIVILVFAVIAFIFKDFFFGKIIFGPAKPDFITYRAFCKLAKILQTDICIDKLNFIMQSRTMSGQFAMHMTGSFIIGLVLGFPYLFWEIWRFVKPGLYDKEQSATRGSVFWVSSLFFSGILFGYFLVAPLSVNFLANYQLDPTIQNQFDVLSYLETMIILVVGCGLIFQLPMVIFVLTKIGIVTPDFMRTYRRHAIVVILIIAAIITPPDIFSQLLVTMPMYVLYEASIFVSAWEMRRQKNQETVE